MRLITRGGVSLRARLRLIPAKTTQGVMPKGAPSPQGSQVVVVAFAVAVFALVSLFLFCLGRFLEVWLVPHRLGPSGFSLAFSLSQHKIMYGFVP